MSEEKSCCNCLHCARWNTSSKNMKLINADELKVNLDQKFSFGIENKIKLFDEIDNTKEFDLTEHDAEVRDKAIDECKQILLDAMAKNGKTKCHEYMIAVNEMEKLKL